MEKVRYTTIIKTEGTRERVVHLLDSTFIWLNTNLGEAAPALKFDSQEFDQVGYSADEDFLLTKIDELIGKIPYSIVHITWAPGPGYQVIVCLSANRTAYDGLNQHDLVVSFDDPLQALQFKLAMV
jgi:hypothetical protein